MSRLNEILNEKREHPILGSFKSFNDFLSEGMSASSRDEYLGWVERWKEIYKELSAFIREMKGMRKQYRYVYRDIGDGTSKRRTIDGENPNHEKRAEYYRHDFSDLADRMMIIRMAAKEESKKRKKASLEEAA